MSQYKLAKEYFLESEERHSALLLLLVVVLSVIATAAITFMFTGWLVGFWAALTAMSYSLYMQSLQSLLALTVCSVVVEICKEYFIEVLTLKWREWFTKKMVKKYTSEDGNNYCELKRHPSQVDNPAQRIQEDIPDFVKQTLRLGIGLLKSIVILGTSIGTLWVIGGSATFAILGASITIPGYLVWVAILFAILSSSITYFLGRKLENLSNEQQDLEADLRRDVEILSEHSESVGQEHGETYFRESLLRKLQSVCRNAYKILLVNIRLTAFNTFFQQFANVFPYIVAAPLVFARQTTIGQLMEIGGIFMQIQFSLNWFSDSYPELAAYKATVKRIVDLENAMDDGGLVTTARSIFVQRSDKAQTLSVHNLNLAKPSSANFIIRELNLTFYPGENTLIKGRSGLGKSTVFKAITGSWKYGDGTVSVPNLGKIFFLPQDPVLPGDTLRAVLAYPETVDTYEGQYETVLRMIGGDIADLISDLDVKDAWSRRLSRGQQQKISFARALLKKPDWLFLDEATSSMDGESEDEMYSLIKNHLRKTTFISIAHRTTVDKYHDRIVQFAVDNEKRARLHDNRHRFFAQGVEAANDETPTLETNEWMATISA